MHCNLSLPNELSLNNMLTYNSFGNSNPTMNNLIGNNRKPFSKGFFWICNRSYHLFEHTTQSVMI